jgi:hypothetical protein
MKIFLKSDNYKTQRIDIQTMCQFCSIIFYQKRTKALNIQHFKRF